MRTLLQILLAGTAVYAGYKYRYKLLNFVLSNRMLRRMAVRGSLNLPFMREQMVQSMFSQADSLRR